MDHHKGELPNDNYRYGEKIKELRLKMGLTQNEVAADLEVTPGYISNVENGRTAMSLRLLIYYARLTNLSLDSLIGNIEPEYKETALDREIMKELSEMSVEEKQKLLKTIQIWK